MKSRHVIAATLGLMLLDAVLSPKLKDRPPNTPETHALQAVAASITQFEKAHERTPQDWRELTADSELKFSIDEITPQTKPSLRYELFSPPLQLEDSAHQKLKVVAMTRQPMWEALPYYRSLYTRTTGPGRYLIFQGADPGFKVGWFPESAVQGMWPAAGRDLPAPDQEPARSWWRAQKPYDLRAIAYFALCAAILWRIVLWGRRLSDRMSEV